MPNSRNYKLEYWIKSEQFAKKELTTHVNKALNKRLNKINFNVQEYQKNYLILQIESTKENIDWCHDKLEFEREWASRAKDELGNSLRSDAYSILAEIELCLRQFINQGMTEVLGFDWWDSFIPENIRTRVKEVEGRAGKHQVKFHHPIEFTFFEDLITIVTAEFRTWPDEQAITVDNLSELLSACNSIDDIKEEVNNRRKVVSFWNDIFLDYFEDKEGWVQLQGKIDKTIIPIRNKVMHHRLIRIRDLSELKDCRNEIKRVIGLAKTELSNIEIKEIQQSIDILVKGFRGLIDPTRGLGALAKLDPNLIARFPRTMDLRFVSGFGSQDELNHYMSNFAQTASKLVQNFSVDPTLTRGFSPKPASKFIPRLTSETESFLNQEEIGSDDMDRQVESEISEPNFDEDNGEADNSN